MTLFTIIADFMGASFTAQIDADDADDALDQWLKSENNEVNYIISEIINIKKFELKKETLNQNYKSTQIESLRGVFYNQISIKNEVMTVHLIAVK
jgi:hypothetical protein